MALSHCMYSSYASTQGRENIDMTEEYSERIAHKNRKFCEIRYLMR